MNKNEISIRPQSQSPAVTASRAPRAGHRLTPALILLCGASCWPVGAATLVVDGAQPGNGERADGSVERPFKTIQSAAEAAGPGDVVEIRPGVYRERVAPVRGGTAEAPIVYRASRRGTVVIKGSDVWKPEWKALDDSGELVSAPLDLAMFRQWRRPSRDPKLTVTPSPFHEEIMPSNGQDKLAEPDKLSGEPFNIRARPADPQAARWPMVIGQIYADGEPLHQALSLEELRSRPGSFTVDAAGENVIVHLRDGGIDPREVVWEITVREQLFAPDARGLAHLVLEDLVFEHAANQAPYPSVGAVSVRNGHHWTFKRCVIRHNASVGLDLGGEFFDSRLYGDKPNSFGHLVEGCEIHHNGLAGIYGILVRDSVIRQSEIFENNRLGFRHPWNARWEEYAGIKLLKSSNNRIEDNYVHDNHSFGIWFDNQWQGSRISRNLVVRNQWAGIFIEFGDAADQPLLIDNNVVIFTAQGSGIYCHDASDIIVAHNMLYHNAEYGLWIWAVSSRGKTGASNNRAVGNVIYGNGAGAIGFPGEGELNSNNRSDYNLLANKTWARSPGAPTFSLHESHTKPPVTRKQVAKQIQEKLAAAGGYLAELPLEYWTEQSARNINLAQWKAVTENDTHSAVANAQIGLFFKPALTQLEVVPTERWTGMQVPKVPGVDRDYFGRTYPQDGGVPPGPFLFSEEELARSYTFSSYARREGKLIRKDTERTGRVLLNLWPKKATTQPSLP